MIYDILYIEKMYFLRSISICDQIYIMWELEKQPSPEMVRMEEIDLHIKAQKNLYFFRKNIGIYYIFVSLCT
ncbi:hypothetical protein EZS27_014201 [termite gut metagenome]|uniref:Uncharacterized protein n=1 Tax=termite gut metagenome TaxID=433724 RepID=A0A5J4RVZ9_9ZZZZ